LQLGNQNLKDDFLSYLIDEPLLVNKIEVPKCLSIILQPCEEETQLAIPIIEVKKLEAVY